MNQSVTIPSPAPLATHKDGVGKQLLPIPIRTNSRRDIYWQQDQLASGADGCADPQRFVRVRMAATITAAGRKLMTEWRFARHHPMSKQRDPVQGEFFNTESMRTVADALVREAIQNTLDASASGSAHVRIFLSGSGGALSPGEAHDYFDGLWEHIAACEPDAAAASDEACRFMVVEDFGTTGLVGDAYDRNDPGSQENDFFYFVRAEGKSGKSGTDRGRWGLGKYVFPQASRVNALFAYTARDANEPTGAGPLLIGQAVLKNHHLNGSAYEPDGWWSDMTPDELPIPLSDLARLESFRIAWMLQRSNEPGLSVVVPYVDPELERDQLHEAVVRDYFVAVLSRTMTVTIESGDHPDSDIAVSADTLFDAVRSLTDDKVKGDLMRQAELVHWSLTNGPEDNLTTDLVSGSPHWHDGLLDSETKLKINDRLRDAGKAEIRVPVEFRLKEGTRQTSHFDVLLSSEASFRGKPLFVRRGIIVSEFSSTPIPGIRAIVLVSDPGLANMLGDAENPAHTTWNARTERFRRHYVYGAAWITFLRSAPQQLLRLARGDDQIDPELAIDYFSIPADLVEQHGEEPAGEGETETEGPVVPGGEPSRWRVARSGDGFRVSLTDAGRDVTALRIEAAYDTRRGNPFARWRAEDFQLGARLRELGAASVVAAEGNRVDLRVDDPATFVASFSGFDARRDLRVRAEENQ